MKNVRELKVFDIVELFNCESTTYIISDEFDIDEENNNFTPDEDSSWFSFDSISKVWRIDDRNNYILIYEVKDERN